MKFIKKCVLNWSISRSPEVQLLRSYPDAMRKFGIVATSDFIPDTNFITKLKNGFGSQIQIFIFVLEDDDIEGKDVYKLALNDFSFFGKLKNNSMLDTLKQLDALVDMTICRTVIKDYLFKNCSNAYKISFGRGSCDNCNLVIDVKPPDKEIFVDEIIKYHKILSNG